MGASTNVFSACAPSGSAIEPGKRPKIAPVMGGCFIQRRLQIVAQGGCERTFITGLHAHGVHQRWPQILPARAQEIGQCLGLSRKALYFALGFFQRHARVFFSRFGIDQRSPRSVQCVTGGFGGILRVRNIIFGGFYIGRSLRICHRQFEARLRGRQLLGARFGQGAGHIARAFEARFFRIPFRKLAGEAIERAFGLGKRRP